MEFEPPEIEFVTPMFISFTYRKKSQNLLS